MWYMSKRTRVIQFASVLEVQPLAFLLHHLPSLIKRNVGFLLSRDDILAASPTRKGPLEGIVGHGPVLARLVE